MEIINGNKGKFIVLYAPNNLGKSEQIKRLACHLINDGRQIMVIKFPLYQLNPTGEKINQILRHADTLQKSVSEEELQMLFAQNRYDFQDVLIKSLAAGITVIAEDYTGTGLAWGMTRGVALEALERMNNDLIKPDIAILLDGERFLTKIEPKHRNEDAGSDVWQKNRIMHLQLAEKYGWYIVPANQTIEEASRQIYTFVQQYMD